MHGYDPFTVDAGDPFPLFRQLRDEAPCFHYKPRNVYVVSRFADVKGVLRDPARFSSTGGVGPEWKQEPMLPMYDPPVHTRLRRLVAEPFKPKNLDRVREHIEQIATERVTACHGSADAIADLAMPLALSTIAYLIGIEEDRQAAFVNWSRAIVSGLAGQPGSEVEPLRREFILYLRELLAKRREHSEGHDVISLLLRAGEESMLEPKEIVAFCVVLLVAGYETSVNALGNGLCALLDHRDQLEALCANPGLMPSAIEELVRFDGPIRSFFRDTLQDSEIAGTLIPAKSKVMLLFSSANRDERHFEQPNELQLARANNDHLGFGSGVHFCLGAPIARMQMEALLSKLMTLSLRFSGPPTRSANVLFRGTKHLPLEWKS